MKKLKYLSVLVLSLLMLSNCSSDDDSSDGDEGNISPETLIGTWQLVSIESAQPLDLNNDGNTNTLLELEEPCVLDNPSTINFAADNNLSVLSSFAASNIGDPISFFCFSGVESQGQWSLSGNSLTFDFGSLGTSSTPISFSGNELRIEDANATTLVGFTIKGVYVLQ